LKKNLLIITNYDLHHRQGAAFSRMNCYQKAIGDDFNVFSLEIGQFVKNVTIDDFNKKSNSGILFQEPLPKAGFFRRNVIKHFDICGTIRLFKFILKNFSYKNSAILLYTSNFFLFVSVLFVLSYLKKYRVVVEKNELETGIILNSTPPPNLFSLVFLFLLPFQLLAGWLMDILTYRANAIIVISTNLEHKYRKHNSLRRIPVLVDIEIFKPIQFSVTAPIRFVYVGTISKKKDALLELIRSINKIKDKLSGKAVFHFYGSGSKYAIKAIKNFISANRLDSLIQIKGSVEHGKVPEILRQYHVAILIRKQNLQTRYGFSTKLGEYLACGLPVLANDISDNLLFLSNEHDSFIVKKITVEEISKKLPVICQNPAKLLSQSHGARRTATLDFDYNIFKSKLTSIFNI
jgi:glycosyltransferase involved in cell wall biosynthesis